MVFCNEELDATNECVTFVTILILIDGFLQFKTEYNASADAESHNPYFNRWFSAIIQRKNFAGYRYQSQSLF